MSKGMFLYKNDTIFLITEKKENTDTPIIVVTNMGELRVGHDNSFRKKHRNAFKYDAQFDYVYFATINEQLLEDIIFEQDAIKGLIRHYKNVPADVLTYLSKAQIQEIKKILNHFQEVTKPKKYVHIFGGCNDYEDELKISHLKDYYEADCLIEKEFENINYYGFNNVNLSERGYWFSLIVTDDEKLSAKYRDVLTYEEFKESCNSKFDSETFLHFDIVWKLEKQNAEKYWTFDTYSEEGQTFYSGSYSKWRTY